MVNKDVQKHKIIYTNKQKRTKNITI